MVAGREFSTDDRLGTPHVAIVNQALAERLWPGGTALGQTVVLNGVQCQLVGVVQNYRLHTAVESPPAMAFVPFWQSDFGPQSDARFAIRVRGDPASLVTSVRRAIAAADPGVPVTEIMPLSEQVNASDAYAPIRLGGFVLLVAACLAVFLSVVALHGMTAFFVAQSTREIGIRLAMGAPRPDVIGTFVARGLRAAAVGGVVGFALALLGTRLLGAWLVGVHPLDLTAFLGAGVVVTAAVTLACYAPARRAVRIDPVVALRNS